ncbi:uncharacterized protein LOC115625637 [Scaptodrosophila lebanonensis]|uniref:Uncharacterized protein LOC115621326 n=1 Tax=Drosophila lebanonensis TaxID=7225 RepID=A0A6J2T1M4_DROLE|nr:uncharacterized protein LOC115621326 [Scaptodrosophila lebanonensis]XP_030376626.1 uncharacterized protein LOC115625637 [Scaptodrosophila lebanonensis]
MSQRPLQIRDDNGEPGCKTTDERHQRFRHFWDPSAYWQCGATPDQPAQIKHCASNELYYDVAKSCVKWKDWKWTEPQEPPTKPDK